MARGSALEHRKAVRLLYLRVRKRGKARMLDEFVQVTGCHREAAAVRLLCEAGPQEAGKRRGGQRYYRSEVVSALREASQASDRLRCRRVKPFSVKW